jgi:Holliday junction resolvase RusA-like endonuclease
MPAGSPDCCLIEEKEMKIQFTVFGAAQPAGSKRAFHRPGMKFPVIVDANPKAKLWKESVAREAARAMNGASLLDGPLILTAVFYRARPKSHFGKRGLRRSAPTYPTGRPDVLKLTRGLEDAMSKVVYRDDSQIVEHREVRKQFGEPERVEVVVCEAAS